MADKEYLLTREGYEKHEKEFEYLKTVKRKEIAEKIKEARSFGDLSENAEYDEAKNEQAQVEERIALLDHMLNNAKIIEENGNSKEVTVGSSIVLKDPETGEEMEYTIVGSAESDPLKGRISNESPVGAAVLGHAVGDEIEVETPGGTVTYQLTEIKG